MQIDKVTTLSQFIETVGTLREYWRVPADRELWFRGECKRHLDRLRPELYRPPAGRRLKSIPDLLNIENALYGEFQRCAVQLLDTPQTDETWDWDLYFLMQHHGAPTRLLDWSDGALMALHFALRNRTLTGTTNDKAPNAVSASAGGDPTSGAANDPVVYVLNWKLLRQALDREVDADDTKAKWKEYYQKHPSGELSEERWERSYLPDDENSFTELSLPSMPFILRHTEHITRRVAAQRSRFMVFGAKPSWLSDEFAKADSSIKDITIDARSISKIKIQLRDSGVTESVIFPDLDGLGREMRQLWEDRK
jgi:hypothetical protein